MALLTGKIGADDLFALGLALNIRLLKRKN